jgi:hypothetical protein
MTLKRPVREGDEATYGSGKRNADHGTGSEQQRPDRARATEKQKLDEPAVLRRATKGKNEQRPDYSWSRLAK